MTVIRQRVEELTSQIDNALKPWVHRGCRAAGGADRRRGGTGRTSPTTWACLTRGAGRPATITGLPDAHSGPAFATLVGLAMLAAGGTGDLRDLALGAVGDRKPSQGFLGRLVAAMKGGF